MASPNLGKTIRKPGRPSSYSPTYHPDQAFKLALLGATEKQIAETWEISPDTLNEWKRLHPAIAESLARGREPADAEIAHSLYHRAKGYSHKAYKIFMPAGASEPVYAEYVQHYPPDTPAAALWLQNRRGRKRAAEDAIMWTQRIEHTGADGGPISLEALLMRADEIEVGKVIEHEPAPATQDATQEGNGTGTDQS